MAITSERPVGHLARALCALNLDRLLTTLFFLIVAAAGATISFESDTWWHLRSGQLTWTSGFVWTTDPLSWTVRGAPWPNHEWLSQLLFYAAFRLAGPAGVVALMTAVALATWLAIAAMCDNLGLLRVPLLFLGVSVYAVFWSLRPHMFTLLGISTLLLMLRSRRLRPWIPALFLLWANLHGGVAFGGALLFVGAGAAVWYDRAAWRLWLPVVAASALATLATPLGHKLWAYDLARLTGGQTPSLREWMPPSIVWPLSYPFFLLVALYAGLIAIGWRGLRRRLASPEGVWPVTLLLSGALLLPLGFRAIRNTSLFALLALPLIADLVRPLLPARRAPATGLLRGLTHWCALALAVALAVAGVGAAWHGDQLHTQPLSPGAIAAVRACPGPLYNTYVMGGPALWFIPERPVFVDSREDPYRGTLMPAVAGAEISGDYRALFAQYHPTCALVDRRSPIAAALHDDEAWALTYADSLVMVFARR